MLISFIFLPFFSSAILRTVCFHVIFFVLQGCSSSSLLLTCAFLDRITLTVSSYASSHSRSCALCDSR